MVNYIIDLFPLTGGADRQMIQEAIDEFHKHTCIKFKERRESDFDYVYFTNGNTGCWSSVGRIGGRQEVKPFVSKIALMIFIIIIHTAL